MKKLLKVLAVLFFAMGIISCGAEKETVAETTTEDQLSVILLVPGNLGDKSFYDAANDGMKLIEKELDAKIKVVEMGFDSTNWEPNFYDAVDGDWDLIISCNTATELMNQMGEEFPDERFINYDTSDPTVADNVYSLFYSTNELSFLAGALAAYATQSDMEHANDDNIIGFIGGMDIPGINDFLVGYIEGALYVDPEVKVAVSYAGDFANPAKGKELAKVQYAVGADIIYSAAGGTGLGAIDAAKEDSAYAIGVDVDQAMLFAESDPLKAETIVSSAVKRIDMAMLNTATKFVNGELEFGQYVEMGVAEQAVSLAKNEFYLDLVPQDIQDKIVEIENKISNGEIEIGTALGVSTQVVEELRESVRP